MNSPERLEMQSADGAQLNLDALYQIAPSCFTEAADPKTGKIKRMVNFDTLRQLLGDDAVEDASEAYEFNWVGKQAARAEVLRPINKTLRPVKEDSVDWDTTQNLYIEGDNLEVLKLLQKSYLSKVKMIYIDPPYNTGNDFVYHDDFAQTQTEYDEASGAVDELGNRYWKNADSNGKYHSDWCSMIYSRLMVARSLLTEDGVIFISIDDNEVDNLRKICDEVFGRNNLCGLFVKPLSGGKSPYFIKRSHEYLLCYIKNSLMVEEGLNNRIEILQESSSRSLRKDGDADRRSDRPDMYYCIYANLNTGELSLDDMPGSIKIYPERPDGSEGRWRWGKITFEKEKSRLLLKKKKNGSWDVHVVSEEGTARSYPWDSIIRQNTASGGSHLTTLFENNTFFPYPKNVDYIKWIVSLQKDRGGVFLDFFSGSATTAHAVMQLNAEDGGNRKFIMVQLPEETAEDSEAYKAGYKNICEIGKERIRRAGKKIKEESPLTTQDLDTGFRVFRVESSNYEEVEHTPKEWNQDQLDLFLNNIKADRTDLDLLFGSMLDWGVQLSLPMTTEEVDGKMIYTVNDGDLVACFAEKVTDNVVRVMAEKQPLRVIFRDSCFERDADKINIYETFKQLMDWSDQEVVKNIRVI